MLIGSVLLIIPGYLGDIFGLLLMIKPIQNILVRNMITSFKTPFEKNNFYSSNGTDIIEGEFYDLHNNKSNISKK